MITNHLDGDSGVLAFFDCNDAGRREPDHGHPFVERVPRACFTAYPAPFVLPSVDTKLKLVFKRLSFLFQRLEQRQRQRGAGPNKFSV